MRDEMDAMVGAAAWVSDADVEALPLRLAEADLLEEIMSTPRPDTIPVAGTVLADGPPGGQPRRWFTGRRLAAVAGIAAVTTATAFTLHSGGDSGSVWAGEAIKVAESAPRFVVDAPGWQIEHADEITADRGSMSLSDGKGILFVKWSAGWDFADIVEHRRPAYEVEGSLTVAAHHAVVLFSPETGDGAALWQHGDYVVEAVTYGSLNDERIDRGTFEDVVGSFTGVDVETWLALMPDDVVQPEELESAVDEMLADIPTPDGFDPVDLAESAGVRDRYHLGAEVAGAVACRWISQWIEATEAGDYAAVDEAQAALATAHDWSILKTMMPEGGYPLTLWGYADGVVNGGVLSDGTRVDRVTPAGELFVDTILEEPVYDYEVVLCND
ncbi:hypothetical protein G1H11_10150 [Phytoactinopolyspora alkaliphila]|uniref:Uncharacterized protein n=1 Tax=Phytoactinopolyspora alkaliphila TaxID=1783498 RepID=A0A6N9YL07_9ACTN|nr:hypothetical protein [Phytoactinopolyspora alkaliphila]NED95673.1 hypothetical protein [Phytoactinopolyspora alkaliphila]